MYARVNKSNGRKKGTWTVLLVLLLIVAGAATLAAKDKKEKKKVDENPLAKPTFLDVLDYSKIVWPNPPAITRVRYLNYFAGEKYKTPQQQKQKAGWMDRLSGATLGATPADQQKPRYQLVMPYGLGVDSKNRLYIADRKVSAVFIVNMENGEFEMIKNGVDARFGAIIGIALDDADRLFVSDSMNRRVLVFDANHKLEGSISQGLQDPGGMVVDNENRFLYVADAGNDQIMVYDADPPFKLLRRIGTGGKEHTLTTAGDFAKPTNVALDDDGNLYVADTWNNRVEIFDADGSFVRAFGKAGDGPGYFARPKGIAVDQDGHIWVSDAVQDRVQVFSQEGDLLLWMGGHGIMPGQFKTLAGLFIDKNNRVFTSEQFPGRVQMFRYTTDDEAKAELKKREEEDAKRAAARGTTKKVAEEKPTSGTQATPK